MYNASFLTHYKMKLILLILYILQKISPHIVHITLNCFSHRVKLVPIKNPYAANKNTQTQ